MPEHVEYPQRKELTGLLLRGEGLANMTPERREALRTAIGELGLHMVELEKVIEPVPTSLEIMHEYSHWFDASKETIENAQRVLFAANDSCDDASLPPIRFMENAYRPEELEVDLLSVHERLLATGTNGEAPGWPEYADRETLEYLARFTNVGLREASDPSWTLPAPIEVSDPYSDDFRATIRSLRAEALANLKFDS